MSRRERQTRRRRGRRNGARNKLLLALSVVLTVAFIGMAGAVGYVVSVASSAPSLSALKPIDQGASSQVFADGGERLGFIQSDELRTPVPWSDIPQALKDATIAIEDERFYKHHGIDYEGIVRAAYENVTAGETKQGGSTITQQLVRNLYIGKERTFERKVREAKLAEELEDRHSKKWILHSYLNTVSFGTVGGQTAVGVQAAARTFFDKPASRLQLHEAALLAGLPQAPSDYDPLEHPREAIARRNQVLRKMVDLGLIPPGTGEQARERELGVKRGRFYVARREQYFFDFVKDRLIDRYGVNTVRRGGLKVHTTIDLKLQQAGRKAIAGYVGGPGQPASAIVAIDPRNGHIKTMVSSGRYGTTKFNLAAQGRRQPGSAFKVMALMTALRRGVDPLTTRYTSKPLKFQDKVYGPIETKTYGNTYGGNMDLVRATLKSDNTVYMQLALDLGPKAVERTAHDMGITTKLDGYPAETLGGLTLGVSPLEMANAYATIASGGWRNKPIPITRVVFPDGKSEDLGKPRRTKVFEDGVTYEATKILQQNIKSGTGTRANIGCPAAGKTGTTDRNNDAWFVGFTPKLAAATWVGFPNARVEMTNLFNGGPVDGGTFPALIWHDYMMVAKGPDCSEFPKPKEPFESAPFFGRYATTGTRTDRNYDPYGSTGSGTGTTGGGTRAPGDTDPGRGGYDPDLYESPPQDAPDVPSSPSPAPAPGGGQRGDPGA